VRNRAKVTAACDFCMAVTAIFRLLCVLVVMELATLRLLLVNATAHPTVRWALQQLRDAIPSDHSYCSLIHDRDSIFSPQLDQQVRGWGDARSFERISVPCEPVGVYHPR